jgi:hypothetical protein
VVCEGIPLLHLRIAVEYIQHSRCCILYAWAAKAKWKSDMKKIPGTQSGLSRFWTKCRKPADRTRHLKKHI